MTWKSYPPNSSYSYNYSDLIANILALQRIIAFTFLVQINGSRCMWCNHPNAYRLLSNQPQKQFPSACFNICTSAADICGSNHSVPSPTALVSIQRNIKSNTAPIVDASSVNRETLPVTKN